MKIKLLIMLLIASIGASAQYVNVGANGVQRQIVSGDSTFRWNLGAAGFLYGKSLSWYRNAFAPTTGGSGYIQNQNAGAQTANAWITGSYRSNTQFQVTNVGDAKSAFLTPYRVTLGDDFIMDYNSGNGGVNFQKTSTNPYTFNLAGTNRLTIGNGELRVNSALYLDQVPTTDATPTQLATIDAGTGEVKKVAYSSIVQSNQNLSSFNNKIPYKSYIAFGNSITNGQWASTNPNKFVELIGSYIGENVINTGVAGDQAADIQRNIYRQNVNANGYQFFTSMAGSNDVTYYAANTDKQANYKKIIDASAGWLLIPQSYRILGQSSLITYSGTWTNSTLYTGAISKQSATNGNTATVSVTGSTIYLAYTMQDSNSGTFSVTVDGVSQGSFNNFGQAGSAILTNNGSSYASGLARFTGFSSGAHTVVVTVTSSTSASNVVYLDWVAGSDGLNTVGKPTLIQAEIPIRFSSTNIATYNNLVRQSVTTFKNDGFNMFTAYTQNVLSFPTDMASDGAHPNDLGHYKLFQPFKTRIDSINLISSADTALNAMSVKVGGNESFKVSSKGVQLPNTSIVSQSVAYDGAQTSGELVNGTGWTSTGWTGSWSTGWTHSTGNTSILSYPITLSPNTSYLIKLGISSGGSGGVTVAIGGVTVATSTFGVIINTGFDVVTNTQLTITPNTLFSGTVRDISVKQAIGASKPFLDVRTVDSLSKVEFRASTNSFGIGRDALGRVITQNSPIKSWAMGDFAGANVSSGVGNMFLGDYAGNYATTGNYNIGIGYKAGAVGSDRDFKKTSNNIVIANNGILPYDTQSNQANFANLMFMTDITAAGFGLTGIGISRPLQKLHVDGGLLVGGARLSQGDGLMFSFNTTTTNSLSYKYSTSAFLEHNQNALEHSWSNSSTEKMRLNNTKLAVTGGGSFTTDLSVGTTATTQRFTLNGAALITGARNPTGDGLMMDFNAGSSRLLSYYYSTSTFKPLDFQGNKIGFILKNFQQMRLDSLGLNNLLIRPGTAGTDSLTVHAADGYFKRIAPDYYATSANSALTGTPTAPTAAVGTNTTQIATAAFVMAQSTGAEVKPITTKTANYTLTSTDYTILVDATSGNLTMTLPSASSSTGRIYNIKKIDASANTVTLQANGAELIDGTNTKVISMQWSNINIQSNGTSWYIL